MTWKVMRAWVEAMRLRTLPVSVAGVLAATAMAVHHYGSLAAGIAARTHGSCGGEAPRPLCHPGAGDNTRWGAAVLCLVFAVLAQVASNFANEYYDYRAGIDRAGRVGPRRGVTEGDITPRAMLRATYGTLGAAACVGLSLIAYGGWWLLPAGVLIGLGALAYSAGPWPLSRHALGEVAVVLFFGVVPVTLTYYVQTGEVTDSVLAVSIGIGLMGANVLIVNNYRDRADDRAVGKTTLATLLPRRVTRGLYLVSGLAGISLSLWWRVTTLWPVALVLAAMQVALWVRLGRRDGAALNKQLGMTAMLMLATAIALWW